MLPLRNVIETKMMGGRDSYDVLLSCGHRIEVTRMQLTMLYMDTRNTPFVDMVFECQGCRNSALRDVLVQRKLEGRWRDEP